MHRNHTTYDHNAPLHHSDTARHGDRAIIPYTPRMDGLLTSSWAYAERSSQLKSVV
jgi:hypothetical protein